MFCPHEQLFLKRLERLHDLLEFELLALFIRPKGLGDRAIRAEHNDEPLARSRRTGQSETRQTEDEGQRRR